MLENINVIDWNEEGLIIQFNFEKPLNISNWPIPDRVEGKISSETFAFFLSKESNNVLEHEQILTIEVPR